MNRLITYILCIIILSGCGKDKLTVNGIDQKKFIESVDAMKRELPSDQMPKLDEAIRIIYTFDTQQDTDELRASRTRQMLNMKTSDEIFDMAERTAQQKGISWSRTSLGPLDLSDVKTAEKSYSSDAGDEALKNVQSIELSTKLMDQNNDGISDAVMLFVNFVDNKGQTVQFSNANNDAEISMYYLDKNIFSKSQKISSSEIGQTALNRGLILPFHAINSEFMKGNDVDISVKVTTPFGFYTKEKVGYSIPFQKYKENTRIDMVALEEEKNAAKMVVQEFLQEVGNGDLEAAHDKSVNPDWRDFKKFKSNDLGFGAVKGVTIQSVNVKDFNPEKERANIDAVYTFDMKGNEQLPLHKIFNVQKIGGQWKIVASSKVQ